MGDEVSNAEAEEAMARFSEITGTDIIFAQTILQDVEWKLEDALSLYFGDHSVPAGVAQSSAQQQAESREAKSGLEISLLSWNVDGLDGNSHATRMLAVRKIISSISADFVLLQEVVERDLDKLTKLNSLYDMYLSNREAQYFTVIFVSRAFTVTSHQVFHFSNSGMGRTLQVVEGNLGPYKVFLLNTHLESMAESSSKRKEQLRECFERMESMGREYPDALIFFGGDLNIRDNEIERVPVGVADAWMVAGSPKTEEYTWDTRTNTNKQNPRFTARCRFDRIFFKAAPLNKVDFKLEGKSMIRTTLCYPSDHWAVHAVFSSV